MIMHSYRINAGINSDQVCLNSDRARLSATETRSQMVTCQLSNDHKNAPGRNESTRG